MSKALKSTILVTLVAFQHASAEEQVANAAPPLPSYQMRDPLPEGDRLNTSATGRQLYSNRCGSCHLPFGMGTNVLTVQRLALGEPPQNGLLENRSDLDAEYVQVVVRNGKGGMPRLSRVEVTDSELERIADYLAGGKP